MIAFVNTSLVLCGGIITNFMYVKELKKQGFEADIFSQESNNELENFYGVRSRRLNELSLTDNDILIANRWEQCEDLEHLKGRKIQFVQGADLKADYGDDWKERCKKARNNPNWELIGVSKYCLNDWNRGTVIPNGIGERFFKDYGLEKDIDILIEGNNEKNKGVERAIELTRGLRNKPKVAWMGRETYQVAGIQNISNPPQEEIPKIYQRSKILIKLSESEGFSLPILEAFASHCAVFTRDMGGNDFCVHNHNCYKTNDQSKQQEWLQELMIGMEQRRLAKAGYETAKEFTIEKSTKKLVGFFAHS